MEISLFTFSHQTNIYVTAQSIYLSSAWATQEVVGVSLALPISLTACLLLFVKGYENLCAMHLK